MHYASNTGQVHCAALIGRAVLPGYGCSTASISLVTSTCRSRYWSCSIAWHPQLLDVLIGPKQCVQKLRGMEHDQL